MQIDKKRIIYIHATTERHTNTIGEISMKEKTVSWKEGREKKQ